MAYNLENLRILRDNLKAIDLKAEIDMNAYYVGKDNMPDYDPAHAVNECGACCCILGLAATMPEFAGQRTYADLGDLFVPGHDEEADAMDEWDYLFGTGHPNNLEAAIARIDKCLSNS